MPFVLWSCTFKKFFWGENAMKAQFNPDEDQPYACFDTVCKIKLV